MNPSREEIMACKKAEEAKREAYLKRKMTPQELWRWQQDSIDHIARLRRDTAERYRSKAGESRSK